MDKREIAQFRRTLSEKRWCGVVQFDLNEVKYFDRGADLLTLAAYFASSGFRHLEGDWRAIDRETARARLVDMLSNHLAYPIEIMPPEDAHELAVRIFDLLDDTTRYYTQRRGAPGSATVGGGRFHAAVIFINQRRVGSLWIEDEE